MSSLRVTPYQYDIEWNNKDYNLTKVESLLIQLKDQTDLVVLPETFSTGFSIDNANQLAETINDKTITTLLEWAKSYNIAIAGSFICRDSDTSEIFNRAFFITPDQHTYYYDKRHLFRMGGESDVFTNGNQNLIVSYKGFNICLLICYDLRFPVWSRNVNNQYDLLIYVANWPEARIEVWKKLLYARAIENMSYVIGVNRIGTDANELVHSGNTLVIDSKGNDISTYPENREHHDTLLLSKDNLTPFRQKFPVYKDSDTFKIDTNNTI
ncbi:amidohydrolase [Porphyromonadaceae bacterium]